MRPRQRHRGFFDLDVLTGLILVAVLGAALVTALVARGRLSHRLAADRAAAAAAEAALVALQTTAAPVPPNVNLQPVAGVAAPPGKAWVRVAATVDGRARAIIGVVPANRLPAGGGGATP
jgi:Tfp pilus assembly protein PilX